MSKRLDGRDGGGAWRRLGGAVAVMALASGASECASAHESKAGALVISHPWVRAVPPGLKVTAGYLRIENKGTEADRLVGVRAGFATSADLHEMLVTADGVAEMRPLAEGVEIPAGGVLELKPAGVHVMFMGLTRTLMPDTYEDGTLTFAKAGTVAVTFFVQPLTATEPAHDHEAP